MIWSRMWQRKGLSLEEREGIGGRESAKGSPLDDASAATGLQCGTTTVRVLEGWKYKYFSVGTMAHVSAGTRNLHASLRKGRWVAEASQLRVAVARTECTNGVCLSVLQTLKISLSIVSTSTLTS